ncbi:MAG: adenylyltransferase/cytidyltransferase family protein [archaeon]
MRDVALIEKKINTIDQAKAQISAWKLAGKTFSFTNGCFDILHPGHFYFFRKAKEANPSSKILVLLLDDANIKRRKGPERPVNKLAKRITHLQEIIEIDYILPWQDSWEEISTYVSQLKPAYYAAVKGDPGLENKLKKIKEFGGKVILLEKLPGFSTTNILQNVKLNK